MDAYSKQFTEFLAWERVSRDTIDVKAIYIDMAEGDHAAGILLSQIIYWYLLPAKNGGNKTRVRRDGHRWIAKGRGDWYDEIRLGARQFDRAAKILREAGLIETKIYKFGSTPTTHTRVIIPAFMQLWARLSGIELEEPTSESENPTSPDREVHIQRPQEDIDLPNGKSCSPNENQDEHSYCDKCGYKSRDSIRLATDIDPQERCPWCFVLDGWAHYIGTRVPQRTGTEKSKRLRNDARVRMKSKEFRARWVIALRRAGLMPRLKQENWFNMTWFLKNGEHYERILDGLYDGYEDKHTKAALAQFDRWLAGGMQGELQPAGAGWSPMGG